MTEEKKVQILNKLGVTEDYFKYEIVDKGIEYEVFEGRPDIRGCVLVGSAYKDINGDEIDEIVNSKNTFKKLMKIATEGFTLEITQ